MVCHNDFQAKSFDSKSFMSVAHATEVQIHYKPLQTFRRTGNLQLSMSQKPNSRTYQFYRNIFIQSQTLDQLILESLDQTLNTS